MRRIGKRGSGSQQGHDTAPVASLDGSLRNLYDTVGIDVTLSITTEQITVTSDDGPLGTWPIGAVGIQPYDSTSYEFYAEGDLLLFTPNDQAVFRTSPFVVGLPPDTEHPKRRKVKRKRARTGPENVKAPTKKQRHAADTAGRVRLEPAADQASGEFTDEPTRHERTAEAKQATPVPDDSQGVTPVGPEPDTAAVDAVVEAESKPVRMPDGEVPEPGRADPEGDREPVVDVPVRSGITRRLWIRVLDKARRYDVFDLDRVPTDKRLRGLEHQHTWDHRVARPEGFASHVCTICGKIRLSKRPPRRRR